MSCLILPRRYYTQPQGAVEVQLPGVSSVFLPSNGRGSMSVTGTVSLGPTRNGVGARLASNQASWWRNATAFERTPAASILWVGQFNGAASTFAALGGTTFDNSNSAPYVGISLKRNRTGGGGDNVYLGFSSTGQSNSYEIGFEASHPTTGNYVILGTVLAGSQALYVRNVDTGVITISTSTYSGDIIYGAGPRFEIGDSYNARNPNATCELLTLFNYALSEAEATAVINNPWQLFRGK